MNVEKIFYEAKNKEFEKRLFNLEDEIKKELVLFIGPSLNGFDVSGIKIQRSGGTQA